MPRSSLHLYAKQRSRVLCPLFFVDLQEVSRCTVPCIENGVPSALRTWLARRPSSRPCRTRFLRAHRSCDLFTGTRGTGKTTCAKIFAKAVNCLDTSSPDPCGECEICKGIDSGSVMDIIEMDAASNNGVDDIRDLRDEVAYLPSVCKYKVYIIDEVHMLSTAAFNALLKTMEEPPEHVIFILATTEVQKVPVTILSRCQRYDFTRITADDIAGRLLYVAGQEKIELDENAAQLIGRLADGAMRDALSILDTCAGVDNHVDEALVRRMAGVTDRGYLFEISDASRQGTPSLHWKKSPSCASRASICAASAWSSPGITAI